MMRADIYLQPDAEDPVLSRDPVPGIAAAYTGRATTLAGAGEPGGEARVCLACRGMLPGGASPVRPLTGDYAGAAAGCLRAGAVACREGERGEAFAVCGHGRRRDHSRCWLHRGGPAHPAASASSAEASTVPLPPDPRTAAALLKIARMFSNEYGSGDYGPVHARWDARSQAIITKADYIRRHQECPGGSQAPAVTGTATPGAHGAWAVRYEIVGQQLTDYWFYVHQRWVFDLALSNPSPVSLYRMSPRQYLAAVGRTRMQSVRRR